MTEIDAKILLNQSVILIALAVLVPKPLSDLLTKLAEETKADVMKELK